MLTEKLWFNTFRWRIFGNSGLLTIFLYCSVWQHGIAAASFDFLSLAINCLKIRHFLFKIRYIILYSRYLRLFEIIKQILAQKFSIEEVLGCFINEVSSKLSTFKFVIIFFFLISSKLLTSFHQHY